MEIEDGRFISGDRPSSQLRFQIELVSISVIPVYGNKKGERSLKDKSFCIHVFSRFSLVQDMGVGASEAVNN